MRVLKWYFPSLLISLLFITFFIPSNGTAQANESVIVVVDTSGSMKDVGPKVKQALKEFVDGLKLETHLSLVRFDTFSDLLTQVKLESDDAKQQVKAMIESLTFAGPKTNFDEAIKGAEVALFRNRQLQGGKILILSDGLSDPSQGKAVIDLVNLSQKVFPQHEGFNIYLIGISQNNTATQKQIGNVTQIQIPKQGIGEVLAYVQNQSGTTTPPPSVTKKSHNPKVSSPSLRSRVNSARARDSGAKSFSIQRFSAPHSGLTWVYGLLIVLVIVSLSVFWVMRRGMRG